MVSRTLRMLRFRGKRFWFLVFAAFVTLLIFRWSHQSEPIPEYDFPIPAKKVGDVSNKDVKPLEAPPAHEIKKTTSVPVVETTPSPSPSPLASLVTAEEDQDVLETTVVNVEQTSAPSSTPPPPPLPTATSTPVKAPTVPDQGLPDRHKYPVNALNGQFPPIPSTTTIYWQSQVERFPVPTESIIQLPTGPVVAIPKIQFNFNDETPDAKINREKRQSQVKKEFQKAWKGYRENAWTHDELSPVSGGFRDPFCGWAATLVDGLDTVYIMGLEMEFEDAVKAVGKLDFTTSHRVDIPMFETTIRYLGGLVAAYDVSDHKHQILLDKAVELADVLLGAFDTPNRMPVLYYEWTPASATLPHRAPRNANTAELGSLSLEFTRLAQLTQNPRYYDAVARISIALSEWLDRGTTGLDGVFPDEIDASGCNRTEAFLPVTVPVIGSQGSGGGRGGSNGKKQAIGYQPLESERDVGKPKATVAPNAAASDLGDAPDNSTLPQSAVTTEASTREQTGHMDKRALIQEKPLSNTTTNFLTNGTSHDKPVPRQMTSYTNPNFKTPSRVVEDEDCKPQGLISSSPNGNNKYGMGGGQDSTYEYMPKQYLLLGGREQIHGTMYLKAVEAIRKNMLFRPMIPGDRDVLFSGAIEKSLGSQLPGVSVPPVVLTPEVEHLTCFIGGMIGMGSKIFELEGDLELAKKLTDGCVWAYSAFASGIMPEGAHVVPCEDKNDCTWDEATWHLALDPLGEEAREEQIATYIENKAKVEAERKVMILAEAAAVKEKAAMEEKAETVDSETQSEHVTGSASKQNKPITGKISKPSNSTLSSNTSKPVESPASSKTPKPKATPLDENRFLKDDPVSPQKRGLEHSPTTKPNHDSKKVQEDSDFTPFPEKSEPRPNTDLKTTPADESPLGDVKSANSLRTALSGEIKSLKEDIIPSEGASDQSKKVDIEGKSEFPLFDPTETTNGRVEPDYMMPLTHKQAVDGRIELEGLTPGFTYIRSRKYILRPEAIESVWYMYRITGDPIWQEKGWKMFEAVIAATSAEFGHSAVEDVTVPEPPQIDQMESFWLAETLKYFYLLFSTPDTISLDDWVLNTEAHPFKRPERGTKHAS